MPFDDQEQLLIDEINTLLKNDHADVMEPVFMDDPEEPEPSPEDEEEVWDEELVEPEEPEEDAAEEQEVWEELLTPEAEPAAPVVGKVTNPAIGFLRLFLMLLVSIQTFGIGRGALGRLIAIFCNVAPIAFYIIAGYLVLSNDEEMDAKIGRTIRRAFFTFIILFVGYIAANIAFFNYGGETIFDYSNFRAKRFWFEFFVLSNWPYPIGTTIWYVQSYLYAFIAVWLMRKLKLMKLDWLIFLLLFAFTVVSGELAGLLHVTILRYAYIPACVFTRALPYILLGGMLRKGREQLKAIPAYVWLLLTVFGFALCLGEIFALDYFWARMPDGHFIGLAIAAVSMCMLAFRRETAAVGAVPKPAKHARFCVVLTYWLLQPIGTVMALIFITADYVTWYYVQPWMAPLIVAVCFTIGMILGLTVDAKDAAQDARAAKIERIRADREARRYLM